MIRTWLLVFLAFSMQTGCAGSGARATPPTSAPRRASTGNVAAGDLRKSGTVQLDVTCSPATQRELQTPLALLHSFFYEEARRQFGALAAREPDCAMAHWGVAMTWYHPLWAPPTPTEMAAGKKALVEAKAHLGKTTDLERGFIEAADAFYRTDDDVVRDDGGVVSQSCHGPREHTARAEAFRAALARLLARHPSHVEVKVFHALALLATAPPTDKTYRQQLEAAAILEPLFSSDPDHPGVAHYLIHAYDYPELAPRGLRPARHYDAVAPWVPHALHMPSHIYTRLGMWDESIEANRRSSKLAREYAARTFGSAAWSEDLHALDYTTFAYLQTGRDREAEAVVEHVRGLPRIYDPVFSAAYAIAAIPARVALERGRWKEAADLPVLHPAVMDAFPFALAHTEFAHAVGAARSGQLTKAHEAIGRLAALRDRLNEPKFRWWVDQVEIQRLVAAGWTAHAEGRDDDAERSFRAAVDLEARAGTHPVTPGQILPAAEQLGDLLFVKGRPEDALHAYESALQAFPNRLHGHERAAEAARRLGRTDVARKHYERVLALLARSDEHPTEVAAARAFLSENRR